MFAAVAARLDALDARMKASAKKTQSIWNRPIKIPVNPGVIAGFKDIQKIVGAPLGMVGKLAAGLGKAALAAGAVGAAIAGIAAKKGLDAVFSMDTLNSAAKRVGMTVNEFKRMDTVFGSAGVGGKELIENIIPKMNRALGEKSGQEALAKLGISFDQIKNASPEERFKAIGAAIADIPNDLVRAQMEADLFGKSGQKLDAIFRQGGDAFRESFESVGRLAAEVDEAGVAAASRFAGAWNVAKDRAATAWQNLVGGMLTSFETNFGPIDRWLLGVWEAFAATAKIAWLEVSTNGAAVFHTFFRNAERLAKGFVNNWREGLKWVFESVVQYAQGIAAGFARLGKAIWESLKGGKGDWAGVAEAFKSAVPDVKDLADRLGVELEKAELIDLAAEKEKIREVAAERKIQDKKSLEARAKLNKQTSTNFGHDLLDTMEQGASKIKDAFASTIQAGSYEAVKMAYSRPGAASGAVAGGGGDQGKGSDGSGADGGSAGLVEELKNVTAILRAIHRDSTVLRGAAQALGVV